VACDLIYADPLTVFSATRIQNELLLVCSRIIFCFIAQSFAFPLREIKVFARNRRLFILLGRHSVAQVKEERRQYAKRSLIIRQIRILRCNQDYSGGHVSIQSSGYWSLDNTYIYIFFSRRHNPLRVCIHSPLAGFSLLFRGF
jgi:hypothetical protein